MDEVRKRSAREDVKRARAARSLVLPINRQIAEWQLTAARFRAMTMRDDAAQSMMNEITILGERISGHLDHLSNMLESIPRNAIDEGRVIDTIRALKSLDHSLSVTRDAIQASGR